MLYSRREAIFIGIGVIGALSSAATTNAENVISNVVKTDTAQPRLFSVSGIHNGPYNGGVATIDRFVDDVLKFGFKTSGHKTMNPSEDLIKESASRGIPMVARIQTPSGLFEENQFAPVIDQLLTQYGDTELPITIQPGNEPNLGNADTGGIFYPPQEFAEKNLFPAIEFIYKQSKGRIQIVTPPMAPNPSDPDAWLHGYSYPDYLGQMLTPLKDRYDPSFLKQNIVIGGNYYIFQPGQTPWDEIRKLAINVSFKALGVMLPTIALEGGLNQESREGRNFDRHVTAAATRQLMETPIPVDIAPILKGYYWWIYNGGDIYDFKLCEWVNNRGEYNPEAQAVIELAESIKKTEELDVEAKIGYNINL